MSIICPNLNNKDVAREFNEIKEATSEKTAYHIWSLNNGNGIDKAPNGEPSILFKDLMDALDDKVLAIRAKAYMYTNRFIKAFGNWLKGEHPKFTKLDKNGEPKYVYSKYVFGNSANEFVESLEGFSTREYDQNGIGVFTDPYEEVNTLSYINSLEDDKREYVSQKLNQLKRSGEEYNSEAEEMKATDEWLENKNRELVGDTLLKLISAFGLVQKRDENGRIYYESLEKTNGTPDLIILFLDYISDDEQGYYDYNSKSSAAHHVIAIGLNNADPETFNHELAHHYVKMFWRSKLIQTALRAVDKPGMSDYEREEALVEFITSVTKDSRFLSQLESNSILQKFWGEFAYMIYRAFNIQSQSIINGLMQNVTKSFMLNKLLDNLRTTRDLYAMSQLRMYKNNKKTFLQNVKKKFGIRSTYAEMLAKARMEADLTHETISYTAVQRDPTQTALRAIIQGTISRNKSYRKDATISPKILVLMQIAEEEVRQFAKLIEEYRKEYIENLNTGSKKPNRDLRKESTHTNREHKKNIQLINQFIETATNQLLDLFEKLQSMETLRFNQYITHVYDDPQTGEEAIEYLDSSHIGDSDVSVVQVSLKELQDIKQNTIGFYINTISKLQNAISHPSFATYYGEDVVNDLKNKLGIFTQNGQYQGGEGLLKLLQSVDQLYTNAIMSRLHDFISDYIKSNTPSLNDERKLRLIYSINTWLEDQNVFGDIGWMEMWLGMASNSKSPLIRMLLNIIDDSLNDIEDSVRKRGDELWDLRKAAKNALGHFIGNFDKMFMEKDDDGFTGNFSQYVNYGKFQNKKNKFIDTILFGKGGIQDKIRKKIGDPQYEIEINPDGYAEFPEECEDLEKEFLHKLNTWYGSNCVRRFTTEYYAKRIDILSSKTRKAQREIDVQINIITRACTIDGKPHTELLSQQKLKQLRLLYRKKSQLSNPYDEFGNLKEEGTDAYQIAKELTEWNLFTKDKIQYTTDYDSFNEAKANSSDPEQFERQNTYKTINPKIFEKIQLIFSTSPQSDEERELRDMRRKLISIIKEKGYTYPIIGQIWDDKNGCIRPEYAAFWLNLKELDEKIIALSGHSTKKQQEKYSELMNKRSNPYKDPNGRRITWYGHIEQLIKKRIKEKYPNDPNVLDKIEAELNKIRAVAKTAKGKDVIKQLSIFSVVGPVGNERIIDGEKIKTTIREPILIYSKIDVDNSDKAYVDERYDETSQIVNLPLNRKTKGGLLPGDNDYTNEDFIKNIGGDDVKQEVKDYYEALILTMKESYESIPFTDKYDNRLPQIGASYRQMFFRVGPIRRIWWHLKRKWGPINESDVDINSDFELRPDGSRSINIPIRYIKRIPNARFINSDVFGSVMKFYQMAKNYNTKTEKIPLFNIMLDKLKNNDNENRSLRLFLQGIVNRLFYDRNRNIDFSEDNLKALGTVQKWLLKATPNIKALTQTGLLALGIFPGIVAYLDPAIQLFADATQGRYIDMSDYMFGHANLAINLPHAVANLFSKRPVGFINKGMNYFGLYNEGANQFLNRNMSGLTRLGMNYSRIAMAPFSLGEYTVKAEAFGTILHSYRYYEGKYYTRLEFIKEMTESGKMTSDEAASRFNSINMLSHTLYNAYHIDKKTGKFSKKNNEYGNAITDELEKRVKKRIKNRATNYNYIVPENERTKIQTNIWMSFMVVMRTFMLVGYAERLKMQRDFQIDDDTIVPQDVRKDTAKELISEYRMDRGGYNFQSDEIENGTFRGFVMLLTYFRPILKYLWFNIQHPFKSRYTDDFVQKRESLNIGEPDLYGLNRTLTEILIVGILAAIQTFWHNRMIDSGGDDDYANVAIDHILLRLAIERMTFLNPDTILELVNSVTASKSDIDRKFRILDLLADTKKGFSEHGYNFEEWDEVKQGAFQHKPKAFKELLLVFSSLGLYNLYQKSNVKGLKYSTKWYIPLAPWRGYWHNKTSVKTSTKKSNSNSSFDLSFGSSFDSSFGSSF